MLALQKILRMIDGLSEWSGRLFIWLIVPLTVMVVYEVIARYFLRSPHIWAPEITMLFFGPHFMLVAAYTLLHHGHVRIDLVYGRFSPRVRGILDIITYLIFFFPFCFIMLQQGWIYAATSWAQNETSGSAALPIVPYIKSVIPVTAGMLLLQGLATFLRSVMLAVRGEE
ncbi:MAG: TRAP transporter small permease subunit [Deltaproteobacteria bacterium]|nr:TRAP transporter small permease subunit [Deltaproteobacteria bacterium]